MSHVGIFCFLGRGHLNPALALGRRLRSRGHVVTVFHISIAQAAIRAAGLKFSPLDHSESSITENRRSRSRFRFRFEETLTAVRTHAERTLREAPKAVKDAGIEALVVDQMDLAAGSVAEFLKVPFVTLGCAPPMYLDKNTPAPFFLWRPGTGHLARLRNQAGNRLIQGLVAPTLHIINRKRREWGLESFRHVNDAFSSRAVITQLPASLDFHSPASRLNLYYSGPLYDHEIDRHAWFARSFPWQELNGKPLIYASMGTIRNNIPWIFRRIAEACHKLDVQLVMSLGGGALEPQHLGLLPGNPIIVPYAPQRALLERAALVINCAGLNTTLDCIACGVPMVAIPVAEDQPGVAARIRQANLGCVVSLRRASTKRLGHSIQEALSNSKYRLAVQRFQDDLSKTDHVGYTAEMIERFLGLDTLGDTVIPRLKSGQQ